MHGEPTSIRLGADALVTPRARRRRLELLPSVVVVPAGLPVMVGRRSALAAGLLAKVDQELLVAGLLLG